MSSDCMCNIRELDNIGSMVVSKITDTDVTLRCLCGGYKTYKKKKNSDAATIDRDCGCGISENINTENINWMKGKKLGNYIVEDIVYLGSEIYAKVTIGAVRHIMMNPIEVLRESIRNGGVERETLYVGLRIDRVKIYDIYKNQYGRTIVRYICDCGNKGECDSSVVYGKLKHNGTMTCGKCKDTIDIEPEKVYRLWGRISKEEENKGKIKNINDLYIWLKEIGYDESKLIRLKDNKEGYRLDNIEVVDKLGIVENENLSGGTRVNSVIYNLETGAVSLNSVLKKYNIENRRYRVSRSEYIKNNENRISIYDLVAIATKS